MSYISSFPFWLPASRIHTARVDTKPVELNLLNLLAVVQALYIEILPISWETGRNPLGATVNSKINEALVNLDTSFAFKRVHAADNRAGWQEVTRLTDAQIFDILISEIRVLCNAFVRHHPNITQLLGISWEISSNDQPWPILVFEKTQFGDLQNFLRLPAGRTLGFDERVKLCIDVAQAILDMHGAKIVHGDIKPQNILIFKEEAGYIAKVTDFGYSTVYSDDNRRFRLPISRPWNAPEHDRLAREWMPVEAKRADLFSLGMLCLWILFEPFISGAKSPPNLDWLSAGYMCSNRSAIDILSDIKNDGKLLELSRQLLTVYGAADHAKGGAMMEVLCSTLSDEPSQRDRVLEGFMAKNSPKRVAESIVIKELSVRRSDFKLEKLLSSFYTSDYRVRQYIARLLIKEYEHDGSLADQVAACYHIGFGVPRDEDMSINIQTQGMTQIQHIIKVASQTIETHEVARSPALVKLFNAGHINISSTDHVYIYAHHGKMKEAEAILRREEQDLIYSCGPDSLVVSIVRMDIWSIYNTQGRWTEAESILLQILEVENRVRGEEAAMTASALEKLVEVYLNQDRPDEAEKHQERVLEIRRKSRGEEHPETLNAICILALTYSMLGRLDDAEALWTGVLKTQIEVFGEEHINTLATRSNLAATYKQVGRLEEAEATQKQTVEVFGRIFSEQSPQLIQSKSNLAAIYTAMQRWEDAEKIQQQVWKIRAQVFGEEHYLTLISKGILAGSYAGQGRLLEAESLYVEVVEAERRTLGHEHVQTVHSESGLARIFRLQDRWEESAALYRKVLLTEEKLHGKRHSDILNHLGTLACIYWNTGQFEEANRLFIRVIDMTKSTFGEKDIRTLEVVEDLAITCLNEGRDEEAELLMNQVIEAWKARSENGLPNQAMLRSMHKLTVVYSNQMRWKEAESLQLQILRAREQLLGLNHIDTVSSMAAMAVTYLQQCRWKDAENLLVLAVQRMCEAGGDETYPKTLLSIKHSLAQSLAGLHRYEEAERLYLSVIEARKELLGVDNRDTLESMIRLASVYCAQGRGVEATSLLILISKSKKETVGGHQAQVARMRYLTSRRGT